MKVNWKFQCVRGGLDRVGWGQRGQIKEKRTSIGEVYSV